MNLDVRFELLDKIGSGSYATVYRARDKELGREVAVKQIHAQYLEDPKTLDRYWAEAQLLASLHHPNIVTIFDIVRERGWLIMELMQGSLRERLSGRQMDLRSLRAALAHCLRALKYLHDRGVIHGDIKPGNMMIDHRKRVKLGDFGLARRVSDEEGSLLKGTAKYIAPEVVSDEFGEVGPRSDLYSLGFSAYELMCGSENFEDLFPGLSAFGRDKQAAWMMWHAAADRRLPEISRVLEGVPPDVAKVIQRLVEKDPARRYQTADEALSDLQVDLKLVKSDGDEEETPTTAPAEPEKKRRTLLYVAVATSLVMSLLMAFLPINPPSYTGPATTRAGVVRAFDPAANALEFEDPESGLPDELQLPPRPKVTLLRVGEDEQFILPRDIQPGDWIEIVNTADESGAATIELTVSRPARSGGTIDALDSGAGLVTVAVNDGPVRDDLSMRVPERAKLTLNGEKAALRELAVGDNVDVAHVLDPARKLGHIVSALSARRRGESTWFVDRVDLQENRLHLTAGKGSSRVRDIAFAADCAISLKSGETLQKGDLRPGDRLLIDADTEAHRIVVTREDLQAAGVIVSVDESGRRLVVKDAAGKQYTFTVPENADLTLGLQPARLGDYRPEIDSVTVSYNEAADGTLTAASVDVNRGRKHDRWGLLIGTQSYADRALSPLMTPTADAQLVYEALVNRYAMDPAWGVRLLDQNRTDVAGELQKLLGGAGERQQVIVYLCGHAYVGLDEKVYLAFRDFQFDDMPSTGMPLDWLVEQIENCKSTDKLLLLDVVHAGSSSDVARQPPTPDLLYKLKTPIRTTDIIGSCGAGQRGRLMPDGRHGAFAHYVAAGLAGGADVDRDLHVTAEELFKFLAAEFSVAQLPGGEQQSPFRLTPAGAGSH